MKITGLILALIGLVGGVICLVALFQPAHPTTDFGAAGAGHGFPSLVIPLIVCAAAFVIGAIMFVLGGRGYWVINDPHVRN